jgi:hypothetical protein
MPLGYFLAAAGAVVAVSFLILVLFWERKSREATRSDFTLLRGTVPTVIIAGLQILAVAALLLVIAAGLFGHPDTFKNIAPVAVWVIWWVGVSLVSAFVGNIWSVINPWSAMFACAETLARRWRKSLSLQYPYPSWLGAWPACALFFLFAWLELVAPARDVPRNVAAGVAAYSVVTFTGFALFGREVWLKGGEAFSVAFDLFGRFAPLNFTNDRDGRWVLRPYAARLLVREPLELSMTAFVLLMLATVTIDGIMETPLWAGAVERILGGRDGVDAGSAGYLLLMSALLVAGPLVLAGFYFAVAAMMARITGGKVLALAGLFVLSLVPIAIGYYLSHYLSLLLVAGQFIVPLASDPFGYGWDLFGTTLYRIDIGIVDAKSIWYLSLVAIITGHVIAVWVGHVTAYSLFATAAIARGSQYPVLGLMVGYTMLSLWIIAQPIVEPGSR